MNTQKIHCHGELLADLKTYEGFLPNELLMKWFNDSYSTSKHLLTLYSIIKGLNANTVLEIGFGRSSFVLAKAVGENKGQLITCDRRNFYYLLNNKEKEVVHFINGESNQVWKYCLSIKIDFAFLDYFSAEEISEGFVLQELKNCIQIMKKNGVIAIHDTLVKSYNIEKALILLQQEFNHKELEYMSLPFNYGLGLIRVKTNENVNGVLQDSFLKKTNTNPKSLNQRIKNFIRPFISNKNKI